MNNFSSAAQFKHEFAAIRNYLIAAEDVVKSGHMPDMTGLESRISVLCQSIQQADPDVQQECMPELTVLLDQLSACEKSMRDSYNAITTKGNPQ